MSEDKFFEVNQTLMGKCGKPGNLLTLDCRAPEGESSGTTPQGRVLNAEPETGYKIPISQTLEHGTGYTTTNAEIPIPNDNSCWDETPTEDCSWIDSDLDDDYGIASNPNHIGTDLRGMNPDQQKSLRNKNVKQKRAAQNHNKGKKPPATQYVPKGSNVNKVPSGGSTGLGLTPSAGTNNNNTSGWWNSTGGPFNPPSSSSFGTGSPQWPVLGSTPATTTTPNNQPTKVINTVALPNIPDTRLTFWFQNGVNCKWHTVAWGLIKHTFNCILPAANWWFSTTVLSRYVQPLASFLRVGFMGPYFSVAIYAAAGLYVCLGAYHFIFSAPRSVCKSLIISQNRVCIRADEITPDSIDLYSTRVTNFVQKTVDFTNDNRSSELHGESVVMDPGVFYMQQETIEYDTGMISCATTHHVITKAAALDITKIIDPLKTVDTNKGNAMRKFQNATHLNDPSPDLRFSKVADASVFIDFMTLYAKTRPSVFRSALPDDTMHLDTGSERSIYHTLMQLRRMHEVFSLYPHAPLSVALYNFVYHRSSGGRLRLPYQSQTPLVRILYMLASENGLLERRLKPISDFLLTFANSLESGSETMLSLYSVSLNLISICGLMVDLTQLNEKKNFAEYSWTTCINEIRGLFSGRQVMKKQLLLSVLQKMNRMMVYTNMLAELIPAPTSLKFGLALFALLLKSASFLCQTS